MFVALLWAKVYRIRGGHSMPPPSPLHNWPQVEAHNGIKLKKEKSVKEFHDLSKAV